MENTIIITGRLAADPETKDKGRGPYVRARLAHPQGHYDKQSHQWVDADTLTAWFTLTATGRTGDTLAAMHKGDMLLVVGRFTVDEWAPVDGTHGAPGAKRTDLRIFADSVAQVPRKQAVQSQAQAAASYATAPAQPAQAAPIQWEAYTNPDF